LPLADKNEKNSMNGSKDVQDNVKGVVHKKGRQIIESDDEEMDENNDVVPSQEQELSSAKTEEVNSAKDSENCTKKAEVCISLL